MIEQELNQTPKGVFLKLHKKKLNTSSKATSPPPRDVDINNIKHIFNPFDDLYITFALFKVITKLYICIHFLDLIGGAILWILYSSEKKVFYQSCNIKKK